jgi:heme-degrading monooxygenase HmoA
MIVRLTYLGFLPEKTEEAKKTYNEEIVAVVKKQKGNLDCRLLEPVDKTDDYISMTVWESKADADAYHGSGVYKELVEKVRNDYSKDPVLKVYTAESVLEPA